ncbi:MAG: SDR family oxidoreductase [bacterium]|nr:SDR family oxidoreductase [bacterium]
MANKKILITGANGLLGQKLIDLYLTKPNKTLIATALGDCRYPHRNNFIYASLDITKQAEVEEVINRFQPDCVINTAAMTNVDACETEKEACDALNVDAVKYLAEACKKANAHFIHISTDFIFDGKNGPYSEEDEALPLSYYGWSKLKGEDMVKTHADHWAILRTVLVYGVVHDMSRSNIVLWAKGALEKGQSINVVDDQFRTPTLAEDLAMGCFLAEDQNAQGLFNISGKDFMNIFDLVNAIANYYELDATLIKRSSSTNLNQPAKRPPITGFKLDKAMRVLNYQPHSFDEGLEIVKQQLVRHP